MSEDQEEPLSKHPPTAPLDRGRDAAGPIETGDSGSRRRGKDKARRSTAPLADDQDEATPRGKGRGRVVAARRPAWLVFLGGLLTGLLLLPMLAWVLLSLLDGPSRLRPTPPPAGNPDLVVDLSRGYLERTAEISANKRDGLLKVLSPQIELAPHPAGGARMIVRSQFSLPLVGTHGMVATLQLAAVGGELQVATENLALGQDGNIPLPGQTLLKDWLNDLVNQSVQERLQSNARYRVEVVDVGAGPENLIVKAFLRER